MFEEDFNDDYEKILKKKLTTEESVALSNGAASSKKKIKITPAVKQKLLQKLTAEQIEELRHTDYHHIMFLKQFTLEERKVIYRLCLDERLNKTEAVVYIEMQKKLVQSSYDRNFIEEPFSSIIEREIIEACIPLNDTEIEILGVLVRKKLLLEEDL